MRAIILCGIPASGKTTMAKKLCSDRMRPYTRINRDDLRRMMHPLDDTLEDTEQGFMPRGYIWSKDNEKLVNTARDDIIWSCLVKNRNWVSDDTNMSPKFIDSVREWCISATEMHNNVVTLEIIPIEVSLEVAVERDSQREWPVGEKVIRRFAFNELPEPATWFYKDGHEEKA